MNHPKRFDPTRRSGLARRELLEIGALSACLASLGGIARSSQLPEYRALVCVFLYGGADTFNLVVPIDPEGYGIYADARGDLAEPLESLLPVEPLDPTTGPLGLHAEAPELRDLFLSERLAFVANTGTLVQPITKAQFAGGQKPQHLFSHNSQQRDWQRAWSQSATTAGWVGRVLDRLAPLGQESSLSPAISVNQSDMLLTGAASPGYVIGAGGVLPLAAAQDPARAATLNALLAQQQHPIGRALADVQQEAIEMSSLLTELLPTAPTFEGLFPSSWLANQLRMVARLIALRHSLGVTRQAFFVSLGGWDTHDDQTDLLPPLIRELSQALGAFQSALDQLGATQDVVTFAHSEFGRTLSSNGKGSDHGWGGHTFALGGPVRGRELYGAMPDFTLDGPDVLKGGRVVPTTSVDQFAATLARWFGVPPADLPAVFPNLPNFPVSDLGFLA